MATIYFVFRNSVPYEELRGDTFAPSNVINEDNAPNLLSEEDQPSRGEILVS